MEITLMDQRLHNFLVSLGIILGKCGGFAFVKDFGVVLVGDAESLRVASVAHRLELGDDERPRMLRDAAKEGIHRLISAVVLQGRAEVATRVLKGELSSSDASVIDNNFLRFLKREYRRADLATETQLTLARDLLDSIASHGYAKEWQEHLQRGIATLVQHDTEVRTEIEEAKVTMATLQVARDTAHRHAQAAVKLIEVAALLDPTYAPLVTEAYAARAASQANPTASSEDDGVGEDGAGEDIDGV